MGKKISAEWQHKDKIRRGRDKKAPACASQRHDWGLPIKHLTCSVFFIIELRDPPPVSHLLVVLSFSS